LAARHQPCGRRRVGRLMHEMGLVAIQPKSFKPQTTDSRHNLGYSPNLLIDAPPPDGINQLWVGDITYVPLAGGDFLYLAILMDRFLRRIIGWDLQDHMRESLVLAALQAAIALRQPSPGLIQHTDRGGQYAGAGYREPDESEECSGDAQAPGISLASYRAERLARLKRGFGGSEGLPSCSR